MIKKYLRSKKTAKNQSSKKQSKRSTKRFSKRLGKGKKIIIDSKEHFLSEHGYKDVETLSRNQRKRALMSLIKEFTPTKGSAATMIYIISALNARYVLNRNTNPKAAQIFKIDQRMISAMYRRMKRTAKKQQQKHH